jgi:hypothetical protein
MGTLIPFWFIVIAVLWTGFFILEGFDFGVGLLHVPVGRDEAGRRAAINTIGPLWDGNEVWLIVAGAAMFAAFPGWYATMFSGLYLALVLLLASLIVRGVAFEYRGKRDAARWRRTWDVLLTVGSLLAPLLLGVALGDLLHGLPINASQNYTGSFWDLLQPYGVQGLASWPGAKRRVISALRPLGAGDCVRGQYDGYLQVDGVEAKSTTETYVAVRLACDSWRWAGVPIVIRAGKCLPVTATEVEIKFRRPPQDVFGIEPFAVGNSLRFRVWPETAVGVQLAGKRPGAGLEPVAEDLTFSGQAGSDMRPYDRLIGAALDGDRWLFADQDTVEAAWEVVDPVLGDVTPVHPYAKGSWGPKEADRLLEGRDTWYDPAG